MPPELVIYGTGPFARLMTHLFESSGQARVVGYTVDPEYLSAPTFEGRPVVPSGEVAARFPPARHGMFVAVGYRRMRARKLLFERARAAGFRLHGYTSPHAIVPRDQPLGENNVLMDQVLVEPFVTIGDNNVFWSGTVLSHEARVGSHTFCGGRVLVGGRVTVGDGSFLGMSSTIVYGVSLAPETHVVAGSVVFKDTQPMTLHGGNPARALGAHAEHGIVIQD